MEEFLLQEGIQAAKRGDNYLAGALLRQALEFDPRSTAAWLWLSSVVDTDRERRECLEAALAIDPQNQAARYGLSKLPPGPPPVGKPAAESPVEPTAEPMTEPIPEPAEPPAPPQAEILGGMLGELRHISEQLRDLAGGLRPVSAGLAALETARARGDVERPRIKTALFVDFDNIYLGLKAIDPAAAERFATDPSRWLKWIERGMPSAEETPPQPAPVRVVLIRNCYLNPRSFHKYRFHPLGLLGDRLPAAHHPGQNQLRHPHGDGHPGHPRAPHPVRRVHHPVG